MDVRVKFIDNKPYFSFESKKAKEWEELHLGEPITDSDTYIKDWTIAAKYMENDGLIVEVDNI